MNRRKWNSERLKLNIKKNMRLLRERNGYSQSNVARLLSVSQSDISRWESLDEDRLPDIDALFLLCDFFDVGIGDICGVKEVTPMSDATFSQLAEYYIKLDLGRRDDLIKYAKYLVTDQEECGVDEKKGKKGAS